MKTEEELIKETEKWLRRLETELETTEALNKKGEEFLENIRAYTKDSKHFLSNKDFVRAFEAVIWAWAFMSIAKDIDLIKVNGVKA